jgi:hypothetical protein
MWLGVFSNGRKIETRPNCAAIWRVWSRGPTRRQDRRRTDGGERQADAAYAEGRTKLHDGPPCPQRRGQAEKVSSVDGDEFRELVFFFEYHVTADRGERNGLEMAKYSVRVELHYEENGDYPKLHKEMEKRGFDRTLEVNGTLYQLPDASYAYEGGETNVQVYDKARAACKAIGRKSGIVVTKSAGRFVGGLREA